MVIVVVVQGRIQDFKLGGGGGGAHLKKLPEGRRGEMFGVFRVKFFFPIAEGGAPPPLDPPLLCVCVCVLCGWRKSKKK
jgi:hypothetical protein